MEPETERLLKLLYDGSDDAVLQYAGEIGGELRRLAGLAESRGEWARRWREGMNWYRDEIFRGRIASAQRRRDLRHIQRLKEEVCRLERRELELERREARLSRALCTIAVLEDAEGNAYERLCDAAAIAAEAVKETP